MRSTKGYYFIWRTEVENFAISFFHEKIFVRIFNICFPAQNMILIYYTMQMTRNRKVSTLSYSVKTDKFIRIRIFTNKLMISQCKRCGGRIKKKRAKLVKLIRWLKVNLALQRIYERGREEIIYEKTAISDSIADNILSRAVNVATIKAWRNGQAARTSSLHQRPGHVRHRNDWETNSLDF